MNESAHTATLTELPTSLQLVGFRVVKLQSSSRGHLHG